MCILVYLTIKYVGTIEEDSDGIAYGKNTYRNGSRDQHSGAVRKLLLDQDLCPPV